MDEGLLVRLPNAVGLGGLKRSVAGNCLSAGRICSGSMVRSRGIGLAHTKGRPLGRGFPWRETPLRDVVVRGVFVLGASAALVAAPSLGRLFQLAGAFGSHGVLLPAFRGSVAGDGPSLSYFRHSGGAHRVDRPGIIPRTFSRRLYDGQFRPRPLSLVDFDSNL